MTRLITALTLFAFLAGCGGMRDSRLNPFNWFGRDREERVVVAVTETQIGDPRDLVAEIVSLRVDRLPGGAIIHAMGLPPTQGHWEAELVALNDEFPDKGTLTYEFRLLPPRSTEPVGTKQSREVLVGHFLSDQALIGVRNIRVIAQNNRRTVRR